MNDSAEGNLFSHLEALRGALWRSIAVIAVFLLPGFFAAPYALDMLILWSCPEGFSLHYFTPMEPLIVQLKVGLFLALFAASPVIFYQVGAFIAPALYVHERRTLFQGVAFAVLLFLLGAAIGLFLVTPLLMRFSIGMARESLTPIIGFAHFTGLVTLLCLSFGAMFQLPLVLILLVRCGIVDIATLRKSRPVIAVLIFVAAALLTPPDVVSQLMLGVPSYLLFELALLVAGRGKGPEDDIPETPAEEVKCIPEKEPENALDDVYYAPYRQKRRQKRRFGAINAVYRQERGKKK